MRFFRKNILLILFAGLSVVQLLQIVHLNKDNEDISKEMRLYKEKSALLEKEMMNYEIIAKNQHYFENRQISKRIGCLVFFI